MHFWKFWNCPSKTRAISNFSKITRVIYPKKWPETNMWLLVNHSKPTKTLYWNWYILRAGNYKLASRKLQNRGQLQNNTVNSAMSISINHVIKLRIKKGILIRMHVYSWSYAKFYLRKIRNKIWKISRSTPSVLLVTEKEGYISTSNLAQIFSRNH